MFVFDRLRSPARLVHEFQWNVTLSFKSITSSMASRAKKSLPKSTKDMSKEMLMETLKKKKESNCKALSIVEKLCEEILDENWLLENLAFINQTHFDDVFTERAILKICGYPLCKSELKNVPSKQYHISTSCNKVFDITERKKFCSNICYKAGMYLRSQLLTSPLWIRDQEIIPKFKLLPCSSKSSMGEEVVFFPYREQIKREVFYENSLDETNNVEEKLKNLDINSDHEKNTSCSDEKSEISDELQNFAPTEKNDSVNVDNLVQKKNDSEKNNNNNKNEERTAENTIDPVKKVEKCINEWFTFDTMLYLYGEDRVKEMLKNKTEEIRKIIELRPLIRGYSEKMDRMINFYSLLDQHLFDNESTRKCLKPLPDYSVLKEDGKKLEIKVRAFYNGQLDVPQTSVEETKEAKEDDGDIYLPTVDTYAQSSLRIKIVLDRFNKIIPETIRTFTTASCFEVRELRNLVNHFTLSAHNITFKPSEWYLMGIIIVKILSLKNKQLEYLLQTETARKHVTLLLMSYNLSRDYLENIIEWLTDADSLIEKMKSS